VLSILDVPKRFVPLAVDDRIEWKSVQALPHGRATDTRDQVQEKTWLLLDRAYLCVTISPSCKGVRT
jgi:hypothetical protein